MGGIRGYDWCQGVVGREEEGREGSHGKVWEVEIVLSWSRECVTAWMGRHVMLVVHHTLLVLVVLLVVVALACHYR